MPLRQLCGDNKRKEFDPYKSAVHVRKELSHETLCSAVSSRFGKKCATCGDEENTVSLRSSVRTNCVRILKLSGVAKLYDP